MIIHYHQTYDCFYLLPTEMGYSDISAVQKAGFYYWEPTGIDKGAGAWISSDLYAAVNLLTNPSHQADTATTTLVSPCLKRIQESRCLAPASLSMPVNIPEPACKKEYLDFQKAGIWAIADRFLSGRKSVMLADPQGVGKTIQAIGTVNYLGLNPHNVLVVGPASARLNWCRELENWQTINVKPTPVLSGKDKKAMSTRFGALVISYELLLIKMWRDYVLSCSWDMVIFDEAHYLKNLQAKRTRICLLEVSAKAKGVLLLTGTPAPNWLTEFYPYLSALAPDVLSGMSEYQFQNRYTKGFQTPYGYQITGGKNHEDLSNRLRGSGWMIRREKREVLPQLPPERHIMIVLPPTKGQTQIIKKERENCYFTAEEILSAGQPLGYGALPEIRHEMGLEKVDDCAGWIKDTLNGGTEKMVVFAYHQDVIEQTAEKLKEFNPVVVYGPTSPIQRQANVDRFQTDDTCRVIIGGWSPLGTMWTLTAADTVAFIEASFVPGQNEQMKDRLVRIGQEAGCVFVYYLIVEGSVEASVLSKAALKYKDIRKAAA